MREEFGKGGLLHYGQGKWYPGEPLPRWTFSCYWRTDGVPLWNDPRWLAEIDRDYGFGVNAARQFAEELARRLEVGPDYVINAYEDPLAYLLKERKLPANVDLLDNKLDDPLEREKLRHVFERGLGQPVGYVLPLKRAEGKSGPEWQSCLWTLRSEHLYLIPGDSPVGLRLPLETLVWEPAEEQQKVSEVDPTAATGPLPVPVRQVQVAQNAGGVCGAAQQAPVAGTPCCPYRRRERSRDHVVRTASARWSRARAGCTFSFRRWNPRKTTSTCSPPLRTPPRSSTCRLSIEGYPPPHDPRLRHIKLTPDPGVLEVNIHPAASWRELVENTNTLYEQARLSRSGDGEIHARRPSYRHRGREPPGVGRAHACGQSLSAASRPPEEYGGILAQSSRRSPISSRAFSSAPPARLRAWMKRAPTPSTNWKSPSASCAGSEAGECPPWMVDRIFRNLLVDVTGNTHRAEFCIDKLYSPDTATGRLGLVEFRSFEMPPHARMSLAQQLLVRALVAWFWREPYEEKPIRWGTRLHDRFLLPYFVQQDFGYVLNDLKRAGYPLERRVVRSAMGVSFSGLWRGVLRRRRY